jgi:hypothetical protein
VTPRRTFLGWLTPGGRLRNRWAAALTEPDPDSALAQLRDVARRFARRPEKLAALWPPFLSSALGTPTARRFTAADLRSLEETGARVAGHAGSRVSLEQAWLPILAAWDARADAAAAGALLTRLYHDPGTAPATRAGIARGLAARRAAGPEQLDLYLDHLRQSRLPTTAEPAIHDLLTASLGTGFDTGAAQVRRAGELARRLQAAMIAIPGTDLALGFHHLLVEPEAAVARMHLERAFAAEPGNDTALAGLLAAQVRAGEHARVAAVVHGIQRPLPARAAALVELARTLDWLEAPTAAGPVPVPAAALARTDIRGPAGEWLDFALGRLHLLDGTADRAAKVLGPLADAFPDRPS